MTKNPGGFLRKYHRCPPRSSRFVCERSEREVGGRGGGGVGGAGGVKKALVAKLAPLLEFL